MHAAACLAAKNNRLAAKNKCLAESSRTRTESKATNKRLHPRHPRSADRGRAQSCRGNSAAPVPLWRGPTSGNPNESPSPYMQPTDLKAIARDAALRGDTKTLFHTLALLERLVPIAAFMDFCTELDELRLQGEPPRPH